MFSHSLLAAQENVLVVMARNTGYSNQVVRAGVDIPWDEVRSRFQLQYSVIDVTGGPGGWITLFTQGYPIVDQVIAPLRSAASVVDRQAEAEAQRGILSGVAWAPDQWVSTFAAPLLPQDQEAIHSSSFPRTQIESARASGMVVTSLAHGPEGWVVVVGENVEGWQDQRILTSPDFPQYEIADALEAGYVLTEVVMTDELHAVVMTKGLQWQDQLVYLGPTFPTRWIDSLWNNNYHITHIEWHPQSPLPSLELNNFIIEQNLELVARLDNASWYDKFIRSNAPSERAWVATQRLAGYYVHARSWTAAADIYRRYAPLFEGYDDRFSAVIELLERNENLSRDQIVNLRSGINTSAGEFMPLPAVSGRHLYFTGIDRERGIGGEDVFVSEGSDTLWERAVPITGLVNTASHEFATAVGADNNSLVVFAGRAEGVGAGDLYFSNRKPDGWGELVPFPHPINTVHWDCDGFLTSNGKAILFASDRPGGIGPYHEKDVLWRGERWGNSDLWVSVKNDTGGWGTPINLGAVINTPRAERAPFLHPDGKTLYFSSSGHPGLGKLDIFISTRLSDSSWTEWSEPVNLGKLVNGVGSDWGYKVSTRGDLAYYASESQQDTRGGSDIYAVVIPQQHRPEAVATIEGFVTDPDGNPLDAAIFWEQLPEGIKIGELRTDPTTGRYIITLPLGHAYGYFAEKDGYYPVSNSIDLRGIDTAVNMEVNVVLAPIERMIEEGLSIRLNNIFFDIDKATLRPESRSELDRFYQLLQRYPNSQIEIAGHTDSTASHEHNQDLSERRAQSVVDYLVEKGFPAENLVAHGYGEVRPVADNGTVEGRQLNRRVEFRFLKKGEAAPPP